MEIKKSIITEINQQEERFNDMYIFTISFQNGDIGKLYKKKPDPYVSVGDQVNYSINAKGTVKIVVEGSNYNNTKPSYSNNNNDAKEDIRFSVAFKGAIDLASNGKIGIDEVEKYTVMYDEFLRDKKSVDMPF